MMKCGNNSSPSQQGLYSFDTLTQQHSELPVMRNIVQDSEASFKIDSLKSHVLNSLLSMSVFAYLEK